MNFDDLDQDLLRVIEKDAENDPKPSYQEYYHSGEAFARRRVSPGASTLEKVKRGRYNGAPDLVAALKIYDRTKARCAANGIEFSLRAGWIREKIRAGVCERTGIKFDLDGVYRDWRWQNPWAPSIDRIVPGGPYSPENCQIVVWEYNCQKNVSSEEEMEEKSNELFSVLDKRAIEEAAHAHAAGDEKVNLNDIPIYRKLVQICTPTAKISKMAGRTATS